MYIRWRIRVNGDGMTIRGRFSKKTVCLGLSLIMAVPFPHAFNTSAQAYADQPLPALSENSFNAALSEMVNQYEKDGVTQEAAARNPYITERLILRSTDPGVDPDDYGAVDAIKDRTGMYILQFDSAKDVRSAEARLQRDDSTVYVEPDMCVFAQEMITLYYDKEESWGAGARSIGADELASSLKTRDGSVTVAVLDTGISYTAEELSGRIDRNNATSFVSYCSPDQSMESDSQCSYSASGHGTHVAGIIAQCTEEVADKVRIMPVRVLDNTGSGYTSDVSRGIRYAAQRGAKVLNLSLAGSAGTSNVIKEAVDYAIGLGSSVVVAAGNENSPTINYNPSKIDECIVVGAVDKANSKAYFSNYGTTLDVMAPGVSVFSNYHIYVGDEHGRDWYRAMSGTSMACPHAAGAAALVQLAYPSAGPEEVERILQLSATDLGAPGWDESYGYGLINLSLLVNENDSLLVQASEYVAAKKAEKAAQEEAARKAAEEAAKKAAEEAAKKAAEEAAKKKAAEEAARKAAANASGKASGDTANNNAGNSHADETSGKNTAGQNAAPDLVNADTHPYANVDYVVPAKRGQKIRSLQVLGMGVNDYVVSWTSTDPDAASVQGSADGTCIVTAGRKRKKAVINAVTASGSTVSFRIHVRKKKVSLKGIKVPTKKIDLSVGQTCSLQAQLYPVTADGHLKYTSSKKSVATVSSDGTVTARKAGRASITVRCGKKKIKIKIQVR